MPTTTTPFDTAMVAPWLLNIIFVEAPKEAARILWYQVLIPILKEHWLVIGFVILAVLFVVTIRAMTGRWGALGSFLYNLLYFSILFIIGFVWGPEVFVEDWINFFTALILYPVCYWIVGWILDKTGLKRRQ
jgi:hypothetical protein